MKNSIGYLVVLFFICSCVTPNYVTNITAYEDIGTSKNKTVTVVGLDEVFIQQYEKTFYKNFTSTLEFSQNIAENFSLAIESKGIVSASYMDLSADWEHINTMISKKSYLIIQNLLKKTKTDFLICIDEFIVKQNLVVHQNTDPTTLNGGGMTTNNVSQEFIIVEATVSVYDVKTQEPIVKFDVFGQDQVFLFSYSKSLMDAKEKMINNSLDFLKKYKK